MRAPRFLQIATVCGIVSPAVYIAADVAAATRYPGYSYADQAVSELFAIGAPTSALVVRWFTVSSGLLLVFAVGMWRYCEGRRLRRAVAAMLACSAVNALVLWNFFPMHMRGSPPTFTDTMHLVLAANPYWLLGLIFAAIGFSGAFRWYSIATIIALLALASYGFSFARAVSTNGPTPWMGLSERAAQYADGVWQLVLAIVVRKDCRNLGKTI